MAPQITKFQSPLSLHDIPAPETYIRCSDPQHAGNPTHAPWLVGNDGNTYCAPELRKRRAEAGVDPSACGVPRPNKTLTLIKRQWDAGRAAGLREAEPEWLNHTECAWDQERFGAVVQAENGGDYNLATLVNCLNTLGHFPVDTRHSNVVPLLPVELRPNLALRDFCAGVRHALGEADPEGYRAGVTGETAKLALAAYNDVVSFERRVPVESLLAQRDWLGRSTLSAPAKAEVDAWKALLEIAKARVVDASHNASLALIGNDDPETVKVLRDWTHRLDELQARTRSQASGPLGSSSWAQTTVFLIMFCAYQAGEDGSVTTDRNKTAFFTVAAVMLHFMTILAQALNAAQRPVAGGRGEQVRRDWFGGDYRRATLAAGALHGVASGLQVTAMTIKLFWRMPMTPVLILVGATWGAYTAHKPLVSHAPNSRVKFIQTTTP